MERDIELTVRYAHAHMTGDAASIIVVTEHGRVTLRMHRFVLGNLAGAIARALWPRVEEPARAVADVTQQTVPAQPEPQQSEPEPERLGAIAGSEVQEVAVQSEAEGPEAEHLDTVAISEDIPVQHDAPEPEPEHLGPSVGSDAHDIPTQPEPQGPDAGALGVVASAEAHDIPTQDEPEEPQEPAQEVLAAFDTVWPKAGEPTAGVAPHDVPTQPESAAPDEVVAAVTDGEPHDDIPTQPALSEPDGDGVPSLAGAAPHDDPAGREPPPPRRKTIRLTPRRKKP
jgi:hypothetical protein